MEILINKTEEHVVKLDAKEVEQACVQALLNKSAEYKSNKFKIMSIDVLTHHDLLEGAQIRITKLLDQQ